MSDLTINIASEFSDDPYGRLPANDPDANGELFREAWLRPALAKYDRIILEMNGAASYGPSFLEEAFGGLVRLGYMSANDAKARLIFRHKSRAIVAEVMRYIEEGEQKRGPARADMPRYESKIR